MSDDPACYPVINKVHFGTPVMRWLPSLDRPEMCIVISFQMPQGEWLPLGFSREGIADMCNQIRAFQEFGDATYGSASDDDEEEGEPC